MPKSLFSEAASLFRIKQGGLKNCWNPKATGSERSKEAQNRTSRSPFNAYPFTTCVLDQDTFTLQWQELLVSYTEHFSDLQLCYHSLKINVTLSFQGIYFFYFKPIGKYLADISLGFWYAYTSERLRERGEVREEERERKIDYFKGYLWVGESYIYIFRLPIYPNVLPYYLKCSSVHKLQYINGHTQLNLVSIYSIALPSAPPSPPPPPGLYFPVPVLTCALGNSSCVAYLSANSVPRVPDSRLEVGHRHLLGPRLQ